MAYADVILAEADLVSYWKLDETSGTTADDAFAANNGTYNGGYTLNQSGPGTLTPNTVLLNGSSGYVNVPTAASLHPTSALTLEAWVRFTTVDNNYRWIAGTGYTSDANPYNNFGLETTNVGNQFAASVAIGTTLFLVLSTTLPTAGVWYFLALTWDGSTLRLYVNGVEEANTAASGTARNDGQPLTIGRYTRGASTGSYFNGRIGSVALYNAALSGATVLAHYDAAGTTTGRVSQEVVEVLRDGPRQGRVSQLVVEVLRSVAEAGAEGARQSRLWVGVGTGL